MSAREGFIQCAKCGVLRPASEVVPYGTASTCRDIFVCTALLTDDVGPDGVVGMVGPNDDTEPPNGVQG